MYHRLLTALACAGAVISLQSSGAFAASTTSPAPDVQVQTFLSTLKVGKGAQAVTDLMSSSPLWAKHPGFSEQMIGQIDAATKAYGPVLSFEKVSSSNVGTMAEREYYLVQHRDMVTRWEFDLVRTGGGWTVGYFGFTDQPNGWFS